MAMIKLSAMFVNNKIAAVRLWDGKNLHPTIVRAEQYAGAQVPNPEYNQSRRSEELRKVSEQFARKPLNEVSRLNSIVTHNVNNKLSYDTLGQTVVNFIKYLQEKGLTSNPNRIDSKFKDGKNLVGIELDYLNDAFKAKLRANSYQELSLEITEDYKLKVNFGKNSWDYFIVGQDASIDFNNKPLRFDGSGSWNQDHIQTMVDFFKPIAQSIQTFMESKKTAELHTAKAKVKEAMTEVDQLVVNDQIPKDQYFNPIETSHRMSLTALKEQVLKEDFEIRAWITQNYKNARNLETSKRPVKQERFNLDSEYREEPYYTGSFIEFPFCKNYPNTSLSFRMDKDANVENYSVNSYDGKHTVTVIGRSDASGHAWNHSIYKEGKSGEKLSVSNYGEPGEKNQIYKAEYSNFRNDKQTSNKHPLDTWLDKVLRNTTQPDDELIRLQGQAIHQMMKKLGITESFRTLRYQIHAGNLRHEADGSCFEVRSNDSSEPYVHFENTYFDGQRLNDTHLKTSLHDVSVQYIHLDKYGKQTRGYGIFQRTINA